jgi:hypothetical protein
VSKESDAARDPSANCRSEKTILYSDRDHGSIEIGNHSKTHTFFRSLSEAEFETEIVESLEDLFGQSVPCLSIPYGNKLDATDSALAAARRSGHKAIFRAQKTNAFPRRLTFSIGSASEMRPPKSFRSGSASCQYCDP